MERLRIILAGVLGVLILGVGASGANAIPTTAQLSPWLEGYACTNQYRNGMYADFTSIGNPYSWSCRDLSGHRLGGLDLQRECTVLHAGRLRLTWGAMGWYCA